MSEREQVIADLWDKVPHYPLGEVPDDLPDNDPALYGAVKAKRAMIASYEEPELAEQCVTDLLADIRHLCDKLGIDFYSVSKTAYQYYCNERVAAQTKEA